MNMPITTTQKHKNTMPQTQHFDCVSCQQKSAPVVLHTEFLPKVMNENFRVGEIVLPWNKFFCPSTVLNSFLQHSFQKKMVWKLSGYVWTILFFSRDSNSIGEKVINLISYRRKIVVKGTDSFFFVLNRTSPKAREIEMSPQILPLTICSRT